MNPVATNAPEDTQVVVAQDLFEGLVDTRDFPSANLLPAPIIARREVAKAKHKALLMVSAVLGLLVSLLLLTMVQQNSADAAKAQAQERMDAALVEKQKYAYVPAVYLAVSSAREELATAMGQEVQVSQLMSGLAGLQPQGVSLVSWDIVVGPGEQADLQPGQTVVPGTGSVTFTGESTTMEGVAAWLDRLKADPNYSSPVLNKVGSDTEGLFTFEATAQLTDQALSGRYVEETK